jgi:hypothetical protein
MPHFQPVPLAFTGPKRAKPRAKGRALAFADEEAGPLGTAATQQEEEEEGDDLVGGCCGGPAAALVLGCCPHTPFCLLAHAVSLPCSAAAMPAQL